MGIVRRQSIKSTIVTYAGFIIGALNYYLLARFFTKEEVGLTRILFNVCSLLAGLCALGSLSAFTRYYPYYKDQEDSRGKNELLYWATAVNLAGFAVMMVLSIALRHLIIRKFIGNSALFIRYFYLVYPFTFLLVAYNLFENFANNLQRTALTSFLRETGMRLAVLGCILLYIFHLAGFSVFISLFSLVYGIILAALLIFLATRGKMAFDRRPSHLTRSLYRHMAVYSGYIFSGSIFLLVSQNIDGIMIGSLKGLQYTAVFELANYIAMVILVPQRSISAIANPLIAAAWKSNNLKEIANLYRKSSLTQLILGLGILGVIWINADNIFYFLPAYAGGKYIILVLGLARLIDLGTGLNYQILVNSKIWRLDFISSVVLVTLFIFLNYVLIKKYGMIGSAWSTFFALCTYNLIRFIFIRWKFGLQPFTQKTILALGLGGIAYLISSRIPFLRTVYIDIPVRTAVFVLLYAGGTLGLQLSDDFNQTWKNLMRRLGIGSR
jgi:O-antigen/teichoic acid export membrane protein